MHFVQLVIECNFLEEKVDHRPQYFYMFYTIFLWASSMIAVFKRNFALCSTVATAAPRILGDLWPVIREACHTVNTWSQSTRFLYWCLFHTDKKLKFSVIAGNWLMGSVFFFQISWIKMTAVVTHKGRKTFFVVLAVCCLYPKWYQLTSACGFTMQL